MHMKIITGTSHARHVLYCIVSCLESYWDAASYLINSEINDNNIIIKFQFSLKQFEFCFHFQPKQTFIYHINIIIIIVYFTLITPLTLKTLNTGWIVNTVWSHSHIHYFLPTPIVKRGKLISLFAQWHFLQIKRSRGEITHPTNPSR